LSSSLEEAIDALRNGKFVLVHDSKIRENEIDMVMAAEFVRPEHIATMRSVAGGLICLALEHEIASKLGLVYMYEILQNVPSHKSLSRLASSKAPYGDRPSFSIWINHRDTYTGVTDTDRALTISKMAHVSKRIDYDGHDYFFDNFTSPGHVPLLIGTKDLLCSRNGHTELCLYLTKLSGLVPCVVICEMLDSVSYKALSIEKAQKYADTNDIPLIEGSQLYDYMLVSQKL
jgi:3,4-dihydroxy 2-butanone 4-phosphate synthase